MDPIIPYCGPAPAPDALSTAWNLAPLPILLALVPLAAAWGMKGVARGPAGLAAAALFLAFVSPLCALTVALFAARGLHHLVLVLVAAPALALAWPRAPTLPRGAGFLGLSVFLWLWHLPAAYALAWDSHAVYWLMQAGLLGSAWVFWAQVFHAERPAERIASTGLLLALAGQMGLIAALLTFAPRVLYPQHLASTAAYGLDALTDQQLAGLVMWVPGMLPLAVLGALMLRRGWREAAQA
jgi:putative membrane protein